MTIVTLAVFTVHILPLALVEGGVGGGALQSFLFCMPCIALTIVAFPTVVCTASDVCSNVVTLTINMTLTCGNIDLFNITLSDYTVIFVTRLVVGCFWGSPFGEEFFLLRVCPAKMCGCWNSWVGARRCGVAKVSYTTYRTSMRHIMSQLSNIRDYSIGLVANGVAMAFSRDHISSTSFFRGIRGTNFKVSTTSRGHRVGRGGRDVLPVVLDLVFTKVVLCISVKRVLFRGLPVPTVFSVDRGPCGFTVLRLLYALPVLCINEDFFVGKVPLLFQKRPGVSSLITVNTNTSLVCDIMVDFSVCGGSRTIRGLCCRSTTIIIALMVLNGFFREHDGTGATGTLRGLVRLSPSATILLGSNGRCRVPATRVGIKSVLVVGSNTGVPLSTVIASNVDSIGRTVLANRDLPVSGGVNSGICNNDLGLSNILCTGIARANRSAALSGVVGFMRRTRSGGTPVSGATSGITNIFMPTMVNVTLMSTVV